MTVFADDLLLCRCTLPCTERATGEDMLCDGCRGRQGANAVGHWHSGPVGSDRKTPFA